MREETERNYKTMQKIRELADYWIKFVDDVGNECAYSDSFIADIKAEINAYEYPCIEDTLLKKIDEIAYWSGLILDPDLRKEIHFRCADIEKEDITPNIEACLRYVIDNGRDALINEVDDGYIWDYC